MAQEASLPEARAERARFPYLVLQTPLRRRPPMRSCGKTTGGVYHHPPREAGWSVSGVHRHLTAQFGCYYDNTSGLMTAALDSRGYPKEVVATRTGEGVSLTWLHPCFSQGAYSLDYDIVHTSFRSADPATPTDWRDAADIYKQWAVRQPWCERTFGAREDLPAWLKAGPAMVRFHRDWLANPSMIEMWLKSYWRGNFPKDTPLIIAYWGWEKVGTWVTPDYFPVFPSDEKFQELTRLGRSLGGHTFLWPSGYHYTVTYNKQADGTFAWDDRARFDATARAHAVCGRDGKVIVSGRSWLQGGECATMCPGDPWTIDWLNQIAVGLVQRGADMVQVDQVVGGRFPACYSTAHGHAPGPGPWATDVFRKQLETMLQACRKVDPQAVVCFEEPNELFIQQAAIQDYRDWEVMRGSAGEPASVFNYLYHEYLPTFQSNPHSGNRLQAAYCLVDGQIPHFIPSKCIVPGPALEGGDFENWTNTAPAGWDKVGGYQGKMYSGDAAHDDSQHHGGRTASD